MEGVYPLYLVFCLEAEEGTIEGLLFSFWSFMWLLRNSHRPWSFLEMARLLLESGEGRHWYLRDVRLWCLSIMTVFLAMNQCSIGQISETAFVKIHKGLFFLNLSWKKYTHV